jgi:hypothetical protein
VRRDDVSDDDTYDVVGDREPLWRHTDEDDAKLEVWPVEGGLRFIAWSDPTEPTARSRVVAVDVPLVDLRRLVGRLVIETYDPAGPHTRRGRPVRKPE